MVMSLSVPSLGIGVGLIQVATELVTVSGVLPSNSRCHRCHDVSTRISYTLSVPTMADGDVRFCDVISKSSVHL